MQIAVRHRLNVRARRFADLARLSSRNRAAALADMGQRLKGMALQDFDAKSQGGTDAAGKRWAPLTRGTLISRALAAGRLPELRRLLARGPQHARWRGWVMIRAARDSKFLPAAYRIGQSGRRALIGKVTGALRNGFVVQVNAASVSLVNRDPKARWFAKLRPIMPPITAARRAELAKIAAKHYRAQLRSESISSNRR